MQDGIFIPESPEERRLQDWLFNPFRCISRPVALILGLAIIFASSAICYAVPVHFDGILDVHFDRPGPAWLFVAEGLSAWLCMALILHIFGALLAPERYSFIDLLGTQALARWPYLLIAAVSYLPGLSRVLTYLDEEAKQLQHTATLSTLDITIAVFAMAATLFLSILTAVLMYRGYALATGVSPKRKAVISFLIAFIVAEIVCKVAFVVMATQAGVLQPVLPA